MSYPPQPDYGQQPPVSAPPGSPYGYPAQYPKKRKKWPWIVGGIALLSILGCLGVFTLVLGGTKAAVDGLDANQSGKNAVAGKMNAPARDGKFQFTVTDMHCGVKSVGDDTFGKKAQGEFCLVSVTVKNVGKTAEIFDSNSQKAHDAKNVEFTADGSAESYVNDQNQTFLEDINPGNQVKGTLVFDVPGGTQLTSIVLHESMFTAGVKVPLK